MKQLDVFLNRYWDYYRSLQDYRAGPSAEGAVRASSTCEHASSRCGSDRGAQAMDIFTTLVQTSKLLSVSAYAYLRDWISRQFELPSLAAAIEAAAQIPSNRLTSG